MLKETTVREWLEAVKDPEIPVLSLNDLGVITAINVITDQHVQVRMTPTFVGCPALDYMKQEVEQLLHEKGIAQADVLVSFETPWSSDRITERGRKALKEFGLAPPPQQALIEDLDILENVECPNCGSSETQLKTPFGPTLCRAIHYCTQCKETFEQFKPL
ncbi:1,2-phenylacetyl-CoA epoxidase subunit PaaD [Cesiribacter sp. SM1]|uniref:1,2-phenylacetyl-CoA epoxidase subunit PaaD n=1 Tax=Cesiribacter sp. SM1 TaxID=2861196 RepID=UPI001CD199C6